MFHFHARAVATTLALCLCSLTACSSDSGSGGGGTSGSGGTGGSAGSSSTGGSGGSGASCPTGLFDGTSCADFLDGCWAPNTSGTCTDGGTQLGWSDGHKIERIGASPGLYAPGGNTPCISLTFEASTNTATLTKVSDNKVLTNKDNGDGTITITCPGGDAHTFTSAELNQDNVCKGIACP